MIIYKSGRT